MRLYVDMPVYVTVRCSGKVIEEGTWPKDRVLDADVGSSVSLQGHVYRVTGYTVPKLSALYPLRELTVVPLSEEDSGDEDHASEGL